LLQKLTLSKSSTFWVLFHIVLGVLCTLNRFPLVIWFYIVALTSLPKILGSGHAAHKSLSYFIVYLSSMEVFARMAKASPFIPYETSKYLMFFLLLYGISKGSNKGKAGLFMSVLLIPALFIDASGRVDDYRLLVFNIMGPLNTALAIVYFMDLKFDEASFKSLCKLLLFPIISALAFVYIRTPDFDEIEFNLGSNFQTSGGFGSNQVSTVLGLGLLLSFLFWINKWKLTGFRLADLGLFFAFTVQGLLTFSRGGMMGGAIGILTMLFFINKSRVTGETRKIVRNIRKYAVPGLIIAASSFAIADDIADGNLSLRYQGETRGTLTGHREKDLNIITTGRFDIFIGDLLLWEENFILGVGVAASRYLRVTATEVIAHVELSRLLAEHGLFGLLYFIILCFTPFLRKGKSDPVFHAILWAFFIVGMFTSFHAAMRTYVTPLLVGLSMMHVVRPKQ